MIKMTYWLAAVINTCRFELGTLGSIWGGKELQLLSMQDINMHYPGILRLVVIAIGSIVPIMIVIIVAVVIMGINLEQPGAHAT